MRVLLVAYACEPDRGSEPAVGWNVAQRYKQVCDLHVLTRQNNLTAVRRDPDIVWHGFDCSGRRAKKRLPFGSQVYHYWWHLRARRVVARIIDEDGPFDLVQHLTLGSFRYPSAASGHDVPFVLGPVGGGERVPPRLWVTLGLRGAATEGLRLAANWVSLFDPLLRKSHRKARLVLATTPQTASVLQRVIGGTPVTLHPSIGMRLEPTATELDTPRAPAAAGPLRAISVGRQEPWKGFALQLRSIAIARAAGLDVRLTLLGKGPDRARLMRLAEKLEIGPYVNWIDSVASLEDVAGLLREHHVFLFTSLREAGGMALVEAMSVGLPAVALDWGGPGVTLAGMDAALVPPDRSAPAVIAARLAALSDEHLWQQQRRASLARAAAYRWEAIGDNLLQTVTGAGTLAEEV